MADSDEAIASCTTAEWTFNSQGRSPCVVGTILGELCASQDALFPLAKLPEDQKAYPPLSDDIVTACRCSSVFYSLLSACALCQGKSSALWSSYIAACPEDIRKIGFPESIPANLSVPHWAYLNTDREGYFDAIWAESIATRTVTEGAPDPSPTAKGGGRNLGVFTGEGEIYRSTLLLALRKHKRAIMSPGLSQSQLSALRRADASDSYPALITMDLLAFRFLPSIIPRSMLGSNRSLRGACGVQATRPKQQSPLLRSM